MSVAVRCWSALQSRWRHGSATSCGGLLTTGARPGAGSPPGQASTPSGVRKGALQPGPKGWQTALAVQSVGGRAAVGAEPPAACAASASGGMTVAAGAWQVWARSSSGAAKRATSSCSPPTTSAAPQGHAGKSGDRAKSSMAGARLCMPRASRRRPAPTRLGLELAREMCNAAGWVTPLHTTSHLSSHVLHTSSLGGDCPLSVG